MTKYRIILKEIYSTDYFAWSYEVQSKLEWVSLKTMERGEKWKTEKVCFSEEEARSHLINHIKAFKFFGSNPTQEKETILHEDEF